MRSKKSKALVQLENEIARTAEALAAWRERPGYPRPDTVERLWYGEAKKEDFDR